MGTPTNQLEATVASEVNRRSSYAEVTKGIIPAESKGDEFNLKSDTYATAGISRKRVSSYLEADPDLVSSPEPSPGPRRSMAGNGFGYSNKNISMSNAGTERLGPLLETVAIENISFTEVQDEKRSGQPSRYISNVSNVSYDLDEDELLNKALGQDLHIDAIETSTRTTGEKDAPRKQQKKKAKETDNAVDNATRTQTCPATPAKTIEELFAKRSHIVLEMLETEKTLVKALKQILDWYIKPLADMAGVNEKDIRWRSQILKKEQISKVFNGIPELYRFHTAFIERIQTAVDGYNNPDSGGIAEIFETFPKKGLPPHLNYCNMFYVSMACLEENTQNNEAFAQFLQDKRSYHNTRQDLKDLLIMPIQRVPRYVILIQRILESTPADHCDHDALRHQMLEITRCAETINKRKGNVEAVDKLKNEITGLPGAPLYNGARYLVHEMKMHEVIKKERRKERKIFLFDDMLVITTPRVKSRTQGILSSISANMSGNSDMYYQFRWKVNIDHTDDVKEVKLLTPEETKAHQVEGEEDGQVYFKIVVKMDLPKKSNGGLSAGPVPDEQGGTNANMPWEWGTYTFSGDADDVKEFIDEANMLMNNLERKKESTSKRNGFYETIRLVRQERRVQVEQGRKGASGSSFEMRGEDVLRDELAREIEREHKIYGGYLKLVEAETARANGNGAKTRRKGLSPSAINAAQKKDACYKRAKECEARYLDATGERWPTPLVNMKAIIDKLELAQEKTSKGRWSSV